MVRLISSVILAAILLIASIVYTTSSGEKPKDENTLSFKDESVAVLKLEENMTSHLNSKIIQTIPTKLMTSASFDGRYNAYVSFRLVDLQQLKEAYPVELTNKINDNTMYAVFRMNDQKIGDYYIYVFFRYISQQEAPEFKPTSEDERWQIAGREVRISKRLSAKDFENIAVGSTINDVTAVDPVTAVSLPKGDYKGSNPFLSFDTFHYTDDGILRITFERKTIDDEFLVSEIELDSSYEVHPFDGSDLGEELSPIKLKINPEHLPD